MEYPGRTVTLRDGRACLLRSPDPEDSTAMLRYLRRSAGETPFLIRYPDEAEIPLREERAFLRRTLEDPRKLMIAAFVEGRLAANGGLAPVSAYRKARHRAELGIAVLRKYWGLGLGTILMGALCAAAPGLGYCQIELEVASANRRAVALYERFGFRRCGERPCAFRYEDGSTGGELLMIKQLEEGEAVL